MQTNPFRPFATVGILVASGTLRVTVQPSPHWLLLLSEAALIAGFAVMSFWARAQMSQAERLITVAFVVAAIAGWFEQAFGFSEVIEFDEQQLRVPRETFGWERTREYSIENCSDLTLQDQSGTPYGLQCRVGRWKTIEFGNDLSQQQAMDVLSALQNGLPDVAQRVLPSLDITKLNVT
jgi:hypothetical protein